jgi:hypothetical protein
LSNGYLAGNSLEDLKSLISPQIERYRCWTQGAKSGIPTQVGNDTDSSAQRVIELAALSIVVTIGLAAEDSTKPECCGKILAASSA